VICERLDALAGSMDASIERLKRHVDELAGVPRPAESAALERNRAYVERELAESGWSVHRHAFRAPWHSASPLRGVNLVATLRTETAASESPDDESGASTASRAVGRPRFCLGAHLDSIADSPGADDNASAVAGLLEIARLLKAVAPARRQVEIDLVVFDLEEWGMLGGAEHARLMKKAAVDLRGMVSLEMIGYCDRRPKSQQLPRHLVDLYPDTGDFIAVIGNQVSETLIDRFRTGMKRVPGLPVETLAVPDNGNALQASRLSDHSPFWDAGYAALMVTDTSFLRNPHYHLPSDTPETLDFEFLGRVTQGTLLALQDILEKGL
jgi:aminopeptidase YwaD